MILAILARLLTILFRASPLPSLGSEAMIPPNIRTLFSEGKEDASEMPGDISGEGVKINDVGSWRRE